MGQPRRSSPSLALYGVSLATRLGNRNVAPSAPWTRTLPSQRRTLYTAHGSGAFLPIPHLVNRAMVISHFFYFAFTVTGFHS